MGSDEQTLYSTLQTAFPDNDIYFSCDSDFENTQRVLSLKRFIKQEGLDVEVPTLGWRCGDHNLYSVYNLNKDYDFYWLIEPDVFIQKQSLERLLEEASSTHSDLLLHGLSKQTPSWSWYTRYQILYPEHTIFGGLFSLIRLSNSALSFLFDERKKLAKKWKSGSFEPANYPNDEVFVCSMLMNNQFSCSELQITQNGYFNLIRKHITNIPKDLIVHPIYSDYARIIEKERFDLLATKKVGAGALATRIAKLLEQNNYDKVLLENLLDVVITNN
ncbi:hypothetical protein D210916BOD24_27400 [Alteromonas sp. D210916BOD_24]